MQVVSLDSETELITAASKAPRLVCVSRSDDGQTAQLVHHTEAVGMIARELEAAAGRFVLIVGQNIAYDMGVFAAHAPELLPLIFAAYDANGIQDTMLNEQLIDLALGQLRGRYDDDGTWRKTGYSLDAISQRRLGRELDKGDDGWRLRYGELRDLPLEQWPERAVAYAKDDAIVAWQVCREQYRQARTIFPDLLKPAPAEARAAFAMQLMVCWGIHTDGEALAAIESWADREIITARTTMAAAGLLNKKGGLSRKTLRERVRQVYEARGERPPETEKGGVKTSAEVLKAIDDPSLQAVVAYSKAEKIKSTYVPLIRGGVDTPIHAGFNSLLETGRTSTFDPNLQNIHKMPGVRECFVPRPGTWFCSVDYDAAELRSWAQVCLWVCGFSKLAEVFKDPKADPHTDFAAMMLGITKEEAYRRKDAKDPVIKATRQKAKPANFGLPGGMGAQTLQNSARKDGINLTLDECEDLRLKWREMWPEHRPYFRHINNVVGFDTGTFRCFGSGRYRGGLRYTDGANNYFQSLTAHGAKMALYEVVKRCYVYHADTPNLFGCRVVIFAHDELIVEVPIATSHESAHELARLMCEVMQRYIPDVPITASPALMRCWSKAAEPAYVDGRLVPWEPKTEKPRGVAA